MMKFPGVMKALFLLIAFVLGTLTIYLKEAHWPLQVPDTEPHTHDTVGDNADFRTSLYQRIKCPKLWAGDQQEIARAQEWISILKHHSLLPSYYHDATVNCSQFRASRGYRNKALTEEERKFPIAYILTVHKNIEQVEKLLRALYMPQNIYCIHVDKSAATDFQSAVRSIADCFSNVIVSQKQETVVYAGYARLAADFHCLDDLYEQDKSWKYVANIAGQEYPLRTNREIVQHLKSLNGNNIIPSYKPSSSKRERFNYVHYMPEFQEGYPDNLLIKPIRTEAVKSTPPQNITIYIGSAYFVASREFIQFVLNSKLVKQFLWWCKDTYSPDELFWATMQRIKGSPGGGTGAANAHAIKWLNGEKHDKYDVCHGIHQRNVCVYGIGDLPWLTTTNQLIANKFDPSYDPVVLYCMEEWIKHKRRTYAYEQLQQKQNKSGHTKKKTKLTLFSIPSETV